MSDFSFYSTDPVTSSSTSGLSACSGHGFLPSLRVLASCSTLLCSFGNDGRTCWIFGEGYVVATLAWPPDQFKLMLLHAARSTASGARHWCKGCSHRWRKGTEDERRATSLQREAVKNVSRPGLLLPTIYQMICKTSEPAVGKDLSKGRFRVDERDARSVWNVEIGTCHGTSAWVPWFHEAIHRCNWCFEDGDQSGAVAEG